MGDQVIPANDILRVGKKNWGGRVMLDDVGMHVGNLSLQQGETLPQKQANKPYCVSLYKNQQHMVNQSQHGTSLTSSAASLKATMQCDALIYLQQGASLTPSIYSG